MTGATNGLIDRKSVTFGASVILAAALNFAFFIGDLSDPALHQVWLLFAALGVNLVASVLEIGDRTHMGAVQLSASLVADLQLAAAAVTWAYSGPGEPGPGGQVTSEVLSLSGGALLAGVVSVTLLLVQALTSRLTAT